MTSNGANEKDKIRISNEDDGTNITISNEHEEVNIWIGNENKEESSDHERERTIIRIKSISNSIIVFGGKYTITQRISDHPSSTSSSE